MSPSLAKFLSLLSQTPIISGPLASMLSPRAPPPSSAIRRINTGGRLFVRTIYYDEFHWHYLDSRVRVKVDWIYNRLSGVFLKLMTKSFWKTNCVSTYDPPCSPFLICWSWTFALKKYHMMRKNSGHFKIKNSQSELTTRAGKVHSQSRPDNRWKFRLKSELF